MEEASGVTTGDGIDKWMTGGTSGWPVGGEMLIRVGSTYGVGGFAMIEARDNGESVSVTSDADVEIG